MSCCLSAPTTLGLSVFPLTDVVHSFVGGEGRCWFRDKEGKAKSSSKLHLFNASREVNVSFLGQWRVDRFVSLVFVDSNQLSPIVDPHRRPSDSLTPRHTFGF